MDREKVIKSLELCADGHHCHECSYQTVKHNLDGIADCTSLLADHALAMLKEQVTTSTGKTKIFQCEKCGYGIDDIYLSNEYDFDVYPHFCPNCGKMVKYE